MAIKKFLLLLFFNLSGWQSSYALNCAAAFQTKSFQLSRNLTQIYIHRNSQFPLHVDLIHAALVADIVLNKIQPDSTYNIEQIALALNNMHSKYGIPVRVGSPKGFRSSSLRYITFDDLRQTVEPIFNSSFKALQNINYQKKLSSRESHFWQAYQDFFDSEQIQSLSRHYKEAISRPGTSYADLASLKDIYHDRVLSHLFQFLELELDGGLNQAERMLLSALLILQ